MYQALYRKWRPSTFDEVVGQEHITEILRKQVVTGRLSHAFLFTGTRGTGKTTCAKILAKAVNCEQPQNGNPCGVCGICRGIDNGSVLDVTEMDAASNNGVDDVRMLRDEAVYAPVQTKYRVYIVDEVHMLSKSAFNALLKIMEEPPEHLIFILATTELNKIPATILSRCQRYSFRRVPAEKIKARLQFVAQAEGLRLTDEAAELLSRLSDGALRDALSLLDQCSGDSIDVARVRSAIGIADQDSVCDMLSHLLNSDSDSAVALLSALYEQGKDVAAVLSRLATLCRDLLLRKVAPKSGKALTSGGFPEATLGCFDAATETAWLMAALETLQGASSALDRSSDRRLAAELCLVKLCGVSAAPLSAPAPHARTEAGQTPPPKPVPAAPKTAPTPAAEAGTPQAPAAETKPAADAKPTGTNAPAGTGGGWKTLLSYMSENDLPNYFSLSNPDIAEGACEGNTVTVYYREDFETLILNQREKLEQDVKAALGNAAHLNLKDIKTKRSPDRGRGNATQTEDRYNGLETIVTTNGFEIIREEQ